MRNYTVSRYNEDGEREVEFTFNSLDTVRGYYEEAIKLNDTKRELGLYSNGIYNKLQDNYSVSEWTPTVQKTTPINDIFKRKEHEPY